MNCCAMRRTAGRWRRSKSGRAIRARHCSSCTYRCVGAIMSGGSPSGLRLLASPRAFQTTPERYRLRPHLYPQTANTTMASRMWPFHAAFCARVHDLHNQESAISATESPQPIRAEMVRDGAPRIEPHHARSRVNSIRAARTGRRARFPPSCDRPCGGRADCRCGCCGVRLRVLVLCGACGCGCACCAGARVPCGAITAGASWSSLLVSFAWCDGGGPI
jgi:hypothetical protein